MIVAVVGVDLRDVLRSAPVVPHGPGPSVPARRPAPSVHAEQAAGPAALLAVLRL